MPKRNKNTLDTTTSHPSEAFIAWRWIRSNIGRIYSAVTRRTKIIEVSSCFRNEISASNSWIYILNNVIAKHEIHQTTNSNIALFLAVWAFITSLLFAENITHIMRKRNKKTGRQGTELCLLTQDREPSPVLFCFPNCPNRQADYQYTKQQIAYFVYNRKCG